MKKRIKVSPVRHTGRLRPHEHTSYLGLGFLLLLVSYPLLVFTSYAATSPPPQAGSVSLSGVVNGKPPVQGAIITTPTENQRFLQTPVTVAGTCPKNTLVEIYKNSIFAGSTACTQSGTFSLQTDLLIGKNILTAKVYDALNQAGPDSQQVVVYYDAVPPQGAPFATFSFGGNQLLLNTDAVFRGSFPGQAFNVPITILGGTPPYAINVQWGDNKNNTVPRGDNATFNVTHAYQKPGTYQLSIQATDSKGLVAFITVAAIINGQPAVVASAAPTDSVKLNELLVLWPAYIGAIAVVASFWFGEQREKKILLRKSSVVPA